MAEIHLIGLVLVGLLVSCCWQGAYAGYGKIDEYLRQTVDSDDIELNLKAADDWLAQNSNLKTSLLKKNPTEDFKMFASLRLVVGEDKCDEESFKIMRENEMNIGDLFTRIHSDNVKRRVDLVVWRIFEQHAENCQYVWEKLLKRKLPQVEDQTKLMRGGLIGEAILSETLGVQVVISYELLYEKFIGNQLELKDLRRSKGIYRRLTETTMNDPDREYLHPVIENEKTGKKIVRSDKIKELVNRYLIEPCSYFVDQLGPSVFIPARWDATTLPPKSRDVRYYKYWTDFRICEVVTKNAATLTKDVSRMVEKEM